MDERDHIFREGERAYEEGSPPSDNPHPKGTYPYEVWRLGYLFAETADLSKFD